jgi:hypothetical protein
MLLCPPLALIFSVMGVVLDDRKVFALVMLLVSGAFTLLILGSLFLR